MENYLGLSRLKRSPVRLILGPWTHGVLSDKAGDLTFPNAKTLAAIARRVPADRILVETDCPYLSPVPHRGKRNEPSFVADTTRFVAELRGIAPDALAEQAAANFHRVFALKTA